MVKMQRLEDLQLRGIVKYVYKRMGKAILDYAMINENDRILVGISGGISSLSLLILFVMRKRRIPVKFSFAAGIIETPFIRLGYKELLTYLEEMDVPYYKNGLLQDSEEHTFWCSSACRRMLIELAQEESFNKIALGHNLNDIAESILLNFLFNGEIEGMAPKFTFPEVPLTVIRPLCYVSYDKLTYFAKKVGVPSFGYQNLYKKDPRKDVVCSIIHSIEQVFPSVRSNIFNALSKIKTEYLF